MDDDSMTMTGFQLVATVSQRLERSPNARPQIGIRRLGMVFLMLMDEIDEARLQLSEIGGQCWFLV